MKIFYAIIILILFQSCSFDNKSGIWKNENKISDRKDLFKDFKTLLSSNESFNKIVLFDNKYNFKLSPAKNNLEWNDIFYNKNNNLKNFIYNNTNELVFKSKKLSRHQLNSFLLFEKNNLITTDIKGNIIVFSVNENKEIIKFNFYKKKYKKIKKNLNFIIENNIIYVSDNIGYLYAFNFMENKVLWAKNYKVPFRSNLKLSINKLIASDQNNNLFFFDKKNGNLLKSIPTEETVVKNQFINNLSQDESSLFFLNTYGSLYSIDIKSLRINWFLNLNQSLDINPSNLFFGNQIINDNKKIVLSSNNFTYVIDSNSGSIIYKKNFSSQIKPLYIDDYLFLISKKNLLIAMDMQSGKIIYSYNINDEIAKFLNIKKKKAEFKNIMIANNQIFIFLKNSYLLTLNIKGTIKDIKKLPTKIESQPIFIDSSILYVDTKNKLTIID